MIAYTLLHMLTCLNIAHACNITTYLAKHCWRLIIFDSKYTVFIHCVNIMHSLFGIVLFLLKLSAGKGSHKQDLPLL
jgi:hypothetical protein